MTDRASLARAVTGHAEAFLLALGRAGGAEERDGGGVRWTVGGSPIAYHNAVVRADLSEGEADRAIHDFTARLRELGVPGSWHVAEGWRSADLADRLRARGYERSDEPGMALELDQLREAAPVDGLQIRRVLTPGDLALYREVLAGGFGEGEREADWVTAMYQRMGYGQDSDWRHYLGLVEERPVATATILHREHLAGLYFVCTAPAERRRGIGAAITSHAVLAARVEGARVAVLTSSAVGTGLYERLGFETCCTVTVMEYDPRAGGA